MLLARLDCRIIRRVRLLDRRVGVAQEVEPFPFLLVSADADEWA